MIGLEDDVIDIADPGVGAIQAGSGEGAVAPVWLDIGIKALEEAVGKVQLRRRHTVVLEHLDVDVGRW